MGGRALGGYRKMVCSPAPFARQLYDSPGSRAMKPGSHAYEPTPARAGRRGSRSAERGSGKRPPGGCA